ERSADVHANRILLDRFLEGVAAGPAVLVGNSMGGLVAMMEAALAPERVAGLVLVAPAQPRSAEARMDGRVAALFLYALPVLGELALRWRARLLGPVGQVRSTLALCCADASRVAPEVVAAHVALARERLERMPWASRAFMEAARSLIALLARRSWFDQMVRRIMAPTLLVQGDRDRLVAPAASRRLAARRRLPTDANVDHANHQEPQHRGGARRAALVRRRRRGQGPRPPRVAGRVGAAREEQPGLLPSPRCGRLRGRRQCGQDSADGREA